MYHMGKYWWMLWSISLWCNIIFLYLLFFNYSITINHIIGPLEHGKEFLDTINTSDKKNLREKVSMAGTLEAENIKYRMKARSMVGVSKSSFAVKF